ncbi:hypothetical protein DERF_010170 [Dermatophagoides farinae]|uniref:Uncharacterized protein n=1 Tax=Dermatophagoides farinae TaxID=6954 RepID=A0A922L395_DERFA|nr:hypothetical protein DERF_010170 [Dermatophagoides farinae]
MNLVKSETLVSSEKKQPKDSEEKPIRKPIDQSNGSEKSNQQHSGRFSFVVVFWPSNFRLLEPPNNHNTTKRQFFASKYQDLQPIKILIIDSSGSDVITSFDYV